MAVMGVMDGNGLQRRMLPGVECHGVSVMKGGAETKDDRKARRHGRGWNGDGPKVRARSRSPGCSLVCAFLLVLVLGRWGSLISWPRPGGEDLCIYAMVAKRPYAIRRNKQTNKQTSGY
jgi:hypothetical protein